MELETLMNKGLEIPEVYFIREEAIFHEEK